MHLPKVLTPISKKDISCICQKHQPLSAKRTFHAFSESINSYQPKGHFMHLPKASTPISQKGVSCICQMHQPLSAKRRFNVFAKSIKSYQPKGG